MLGKDQLNQQAFPLIRASLLEVLPLESREDHANKISGTNYALKMSITIAGKTVERPIPASINVQQGKLLLQAVAELNFTDFGIEPFSAFLGAVKNQDKFHLLVDVNAARLDVSSSPSK